MVKTKYSLFNEISDIQVTIMQLVDTWVREEKVPIPHKEIVKQMIAKGTKEFTTENVLNTLIRKGYLRRASLRSNKTFYVQLRTIRHENSDENTG